MDFLQTVIQHHIEKIMAGKDQIVKDSLSLHHGLPLTEETFKRLSRFTFEDQPGVEVWVLDSTRSDDWLDPKTYVCRFEGLDKCVMKI